MALQQQDVKEDAGAPLSPMQTDIHEDKSLAKHETHEEEIKPKGDYSGAIAKTDPAEKKLVRKLDIWIMVRSQIMKALLENHTKKVLSLCSG
jgi:hypothetical protein